MHRSDPSLQLALSPLAAPGNTLQLVLYRPTLRLADDSHKREADNIITTPTVVAPERTGLCVTDFDFFKEVGHGGFGTVFLAEHRSTKTTVAVKRITKGERVKEADIVREAELMKTLSDIPGVVSLLGYFHDSDFYYIVMVRLPG